MATTRTPPFLLTPMDNVMNHLYTLQLLFFSESENIDISTVTDTLREGLAKTLEAIPVLSGTVQMINQRGALCVAAPWCAINDIFKVKDLRQEEGTLYQALRDNQFPLEGLDGGILPPLAGRHGSGLELPPKPVMSTQVNMVKGGIILALAIHHNFTDANGLPTIVKVWAAYCKGDDGSRLITQEMLDRERLMRGWGTASLSDFPEFGMIRNEKQASFSGILANIYTTILGWLTSRLPRSQKSPKKIKDHVSPKLEAAIFFFSKSKLAELKSMASEMEHVKGGDRWVSTIDTLSALLGCCIASVRDKETRTRADRSFVIQSAISGRRLIDPPLPTGYIGNFLSSTRVSAPNQNINSTPAKVAEIAYLIRDQIKQRDELYFRGIIAALLSVEDLTKVLIAPISPSEDRLFITSWAAHDVYDINWGKVIGPRIERVRRIPLAVPYICWIMPELKAPWFAQNECGLEVIVSGLKKEQMARLKQNDLFMRFAQWRCN